jgi:hypothetical protein
MGNGEPKMTCKIVLNPHRVLFHPDATPQSGIPDGFPIFLSKMVEKWLDEHPAVRVRSALPIMQDGQTIIVHLYFAGDASIVKKAQEPKPKEEDKSE